MPVPGARLAWWRQEALRGDVHRVLERLNAARSSPTSTRRRSEFLTDALCVAVGAIGQTPDDGRGTLARLRSLLDLEPDAAALERVLESALGRPERKLAVYGTLAPGEANHAVIASIRGSWHDGVVRGRLSRIGWGIDYGFPALTWCPTGSPVPVRLLFAADLPQHWERIDRFEGDAYRRTLVPIDGPSGIVAVANIYEARPPEVERAN